MTGPEGDAEPLRVPPWLTGPAPSSGPRIPPGAAAPDAAEAPAAVPAPADETGDEPAQWPAAVDRDGWHAAAEQSELRRVLAPWRARLIVAGVAAALSLLSILLVSTQFGGDGPDRRAAPPAGAPSPVDVSAAGAAPTEAAPTTPASPAHSPSQIGRAHV